MCSDSKLPALPSTTTPRPLRPHNKPHPTRQEQRQARWERLALSQAQRAPANGLHRRPAARARAPCPPGRGQPLFAHQSGYPQSASPPRPEPPPRRANVASKGPGAAICPCQADVYATWAGEGQTAGGCGDHRVTPPDLQAESRGDSASPREEAPTFLCLGGRGGGRRELHL